MAFLKYSKASITGMVSCYPPNIIDNLTVSPLLTEKEAAKVVKATGIKERRFVSEGVCASDLCAQAAEHLLDDMGIDRDSIDVLIFLSQTPDYLGVPATSCALQARLGLSTETAAFDMVLGCSGFIYALSTAYAYVEAGAKRVLLLVGETMSDFTSLEDRTTALLFGDGGAAIMVEGKDTASTSYFSLRTDGKGTDAIKIPSGGYRSPSNAENVQLQTFEDGSRRTGLHVTMDGMKVFDFTMKEVVQNIQSVLSFAEVDIDDVDTFFMHQANKFMLNMFAKKLKIAKEKMPISIHKFGNTSTVSIPLTITDHIQEGGHKPLNSILCGYGSGLSWGTAYLDMSSCTLYKQIEYK
ncbi:3-oxoacyl-[acyl-carrier-protein] synthase-3 [Litorimonas taeanensis]|uniref:3-oxoacyl-[acyl-carrier-protein] synthase-3 n=1 Tax=Litorimonas taeanensis TaxID=568099 RepID=A0A420WMH2_9PROT|nr:ketoacyl-ACP synthase III [Litorimonas taeanensis]RKQ72207.1 3-oxoacyl-[acyl-carrier-protein] synthase-3 [Litorimonas taeanensis]